MNKIFSLETQSSLYNPHNRYESSRYTIMIDIVVTNSYLRLEFNDIRFKSNSVSTVILKRIAD